MDYTSRIGPHSKIIRVVLVISLFVVVVFLYAKWPNSTSSSLQTSGGNVESLQLENCRQKLINLKNRLQEKNSPVNCPPAQECKCYNGEERPPNSDGQVHMGTTFGIALNNLAKRKDVELIFELGTWFGGGSTKCIADGLKEKGSGELYTLEIYEPAWQYARKTYSDKYPFIRFLLGCSVGVDGYLKPEEIPEKEKGEHFRLYYQRDLDITKKCVPMLKPMCMANHFDLILIDDNEYTGWAEFKIVDEYCKPRYLALHDVGTLKTHKIQEYMRTDQGKQDWKLMESGQDAAQWEIYAYKKWQPRD
jgi:hypothetical protein